MLRFSKGFWSLLSASLSEALRSARLPAAPSGWRRCDPCRSGCAGRKRRSSLAGRCCGSEAAGGLLVASGAASSSPA